MSAQPPQHSGPDVVTVLLIGSIMLYVIALATRTLALSALAGALTGAAIALMAKGH